MRNSKTQRIASVAGAALAVGIAAVLAGVETLKPDNKFVPRAEPMGAAFSELRAYDGVNLWELPDADRYRVDGLIEDIVGPREKIFWQNWLVSISKECGNESRMYIVQIYPTPSTPGVSRCTIHLVSSSEQVIWTHTFDIGYRAWPEAAKLGDEHGFLCLTVETRGWFTGETRQFYRVAEPVVELIRYEKMDGTFIEEDIDLFSCDIGGRPTSLQYETKLMSSNPVEQLRSLALFWSVDVVEAERKNRRLTVRENVRRRLGELSQSDDLWIREESVCALRLLERIRVRLPQ